LAVEARRQVEARRPFGGGSAAAVWRWRAGGRLAEGGAAAVWRRGVRRPFGGEKLRAAHTPDPGRGMPLEGVAVEARRPWGNPGHLGPRGRGGRQNGGPKVCCRGPEVTYVGALRLLMARVGHLWRK
jgi:hypothetical protein